MVVIGGVPLLPNTNRKVWNVLFNVRTYWAWCRWIRRPTLGFLCNLLFTIINNTVLYFLPIIWLILNMSSLLMQVHSIPFGFAIPFGCRLTQFLFLKLFLRFLADWDRLHPVGDDLHLLQVVCPSMYPINLPELDYELQIYNGKYCRYWCYYHLVMGWVRVKGLIEVVRCKGGWSGRAAEA